VTETPFVHGCGSPFSLHSGRRGDRVVCDLSVSKVPALSAESHQINTKNAHQSRKCMEMITHVARRLSHTTLCLQGPWRQLGSVLVLEQAPHGWT